MGSRRMVYRYIERERESDRARESERESERKRERGGERERERGREKERERLQVERLLRERAKGVLDLKLSWRLYLSASTVYQPSRQCVSLVDSLLASLLVSRHTAEPAQMLTPPAPRAAKLLPGQRVKLSLSGHRE